jgi:hypothetical protein
MSSEYLSRLSDDELKSAFVEAFKSWASDYGRDDFRSSTDLYVRELKSRNLQPPYDLVANEMTSLAEKIRESERVNSDALQKVQHGLEQDLAQFVQDRNATK